MSPCPPLSYKHAYENQMSDINPETPEATTCSVLEALFVAIGLSLIYKDIVHVMHTESEKWN